MVPVFIQQSVQRLATEVVARLAVVVAFVFRQLSVDGEAVEVEVKPESKSLFVVKDAAQ